MFKRLREKLLRCESGNAAMLTALSIPALVGGAGYAVDTAQWYTWKQELQFAADQAAIAGAWARSEDETESSYEARSSQEFDANLSITESIAAEPTIALANYAGGSQNSVTVTASATSELPFTSFLLGKATTVSVTSQAQFEEGGTYTSCVIATDADDDGAITLAGNVSITAGCGLAALSNSDTAIVVNGQPTIDIGYVLAAGGIDDWLDQNGANTVLENQTGLFDPYENLTPPDNSSPQSYNCVTTGRGKDKVSLAALAPGTYSGGFDTKCDTVFSGGIYVIDGGRLKITSQYDVAGGGVMFVLKNGAYIDIAGGANINLTAMTASELIAAGVSADDADDLEGMLVFEDPNSQGSDKNSINGNASTVFNGIVYLPNSHIAFQGTMTVTSRCFMLAAATISIGGGANMSTFCPAGEASDTVVANTKAKVRLVG